ncbi:MAG: hypothetical protein PHQ89_00630 [Bacilli bacterium]|nr:hypothetical protein [Bacilli bacterium]
MRLKYNKIINLLPPKTKELLQEAIKIFINIKIFIENDDKIERQDDSFEIIALFLALTKTESDCKLLLSDYGIDFGRLNYNYFNNQIIPEQIGDSFTSEDYSKFYYLYFQEKIEEIETISRYNNPGLSISTFCPEYFLPYVLNCEFLNNNTIFKLLKETYGFSDIGYDDLCEEADELLEYVMDEENYGDKFEEKRIKLLSEQVVDLNKYSAEYGIIDGVTLEDLYILDQQNYKKDQVEKGKVLKFENKKNS